MKGQLHILKILLLSFEILNFCLLFMAALSIIPVQAKPLDIVLNCTALIIIAELDDEYFKCFPCQAPIDQDYKTQAETFEKILKFMKKILYVAGIFGNFIYLAISYSYFYHHATVTDDMSE
jgi:hypothetical protein